MVTRLLRALRSWWRYTWAQADVEALRRPRDPRLQYPKLRELMPTRAEPPAIDVLERFGERPARSIRCAPSSQLPRAWTVKR